MEKKTWDCENFVHLNRICDRYAYSIALKIYVKSQYTVINIFTNIFVNLFLIKVLRCESVKEISSVAVKSVTIGLGWFNFK